MAFLVLWAAGVPIALWFFGRVEKRRSTAQKIPVNKAGVVLSSVAWPIFFVVGIALAIKDL